MAMSKELGIISGAFRCDYRGITDEEKFPPRTLERRTADVREKKLVEEFVKVSEHYLAQERKTLTPTHQIRESNYR